MPRCGWVTVVKSVAPRRARKAYCDLTVQVYVLYSTPPSMSLSMDIVNNVEPGKVPSSMSDSKSSAKSPSAFTVLEQFTRPLPALARRRRQPRRSYTILILPNCTSNNLAPTVHAPEPFLPVQNSFV